MTEEKVGKLKPLSFKKGNSVCNLCRQKNNLTYDHVPPRCCGNDRAVVVRRVFERELAAPQFGVKSHNGLKFRTLCKTCNSELLGSWDTAIGDFSRQAAPIALPTVDLPDKVTISVRPGAIVRSFLGHIIAAKVRDEESKTDATIRAYLTGSAALPATFKVYCWLYPFEPVIVSLDFTFVQIGSPLPSPGVVSVVKFFPLGFCFIDGNGSLAEDHITALHGFAELAPSETATITLARKPVLDPAYPNLPRGNHMVLGGRTYTDSITTGDGASSLVTDGRRIKAERWEAGDTPTFPNLHVFAEVGNPTQRERPHDV
jgi:hypothetical protein